MSSLTYPANDSSYLPKLYHLGFHPRLSTLLVSSFSHGLFAFKTGISAALVLGSVALTQRATDT
jgi:hypothetical protein